LKRGIITFITGIILVVLFAILLAACRPMTTHAAGVTKYTTRKTCMYNKAYGKVVKKLQRNTAVKQVKVGKAWAKVIYKGRTLYCRKKWLHPQKSPKLYDGAYFKRAGVIWWNGYKYTWYSQRVLPGYGLKIPGRHLDGQGFVCDNNGYIVLGSNTANRGKLIATPFGRFGKVYDAGYVGTYWFDCYTAW